VGISSVPRARLRDLALIEGEAVADAVTVDQLAAGDHACLTFTDADERLDLVAEFVAAGLQGGQKVIWFNGSQTASDLAAELSLREVPVGAAVHSGQLAICAGQDAWLAAGRANASAMIARLERELRDALARGFAGLRVTADMCWATAPIVAAEQLLAFETQAAGLFTGDLVTAICQYDRDLFDPVTLGFAADTHPKAVTALAYYDTPLARICRQHRPPGIRIAGEIDYTHLPPLLQALAEAVRLDDTVHVNLRKLRFIDVTAATAIAKAAVNLPAGRYMIVTCPSVVSTVFDAVGVSEIAQMRIVSQP
jgi:ABC-type transporter Mla MlaB component